MRLKNYYEKIRATEATLPEGFVVVVSQETSDGGRAGVRTETPRYVAARLIVEGRARIATEEEAGAFRETVVEARRAADQETAAKSVQLTVISASELKALKSPRTAKD